MKQFEYEITKHPTDNFEHLVYFCTEHGECDLKGLPSGQLDVLSGILNERGVQGWELVQLFFGQDGVVAFWKRAIEASDNQE